MNSTDFERLINNVYELMKLAGQSLENQPVITGEVAAAIWEHYYLGVMPSFYPENIHLLTKDGTTKKGKIMPPILLEVGAFTNIEGIMRTTSMYTNGYVPFALTFGQATKYCAISIFGKMLNIEMMDQILERYADFQNIGSLTVIAIIKAIIAVNADATVDTGNLVELLGDVSYDAVFNYETTLVRI